MKRKIGYGILIVLIISFFGYRYIYKSHRDISTETATYIISIPELEQEFAANDGLASIKYEDQTVELTARVTEVDVENRAIVLENKVFASFDTDLPKAIVSGGIIKIKARFLGYDELLEEFKMDQSSIVQ